MNTIIDNLRDEESGQGMVEYGLIIVLIAMAAVGSVRIFGGGVLEMFNDIVGKLP